MNLWSNKLRHSKYHAIRSSVRWRHNFSLLNSINVESEQREKFVYLKRVAFTRLQNDSHCKFRHGKAAEKILALQNFYFLWLNGDKKKSINIIRILNLFSLLVSKHESLI